MTAASFKKLFPAALKIGTLLGLALCLFFLSGVFERPEQVLLDARYRLRGEADPHPAIVIIGITNRCLNQLGKFPWPRTYHADLIDFLKKSGAKVIAIDIFFSQPDPDPEVDRRLAESIKNAGNVILPVFMPYRFPSAASGRNFVRVESLIESTPAISAAAADLGHINMLADSDGTYRRALLGIEHLGRRFFSLGIEAALKFQGQPASSVSWPGDYFINFSDVENKSARFAFSDVVKGLVPGHNFKNKMVFVGQTTQGLPNADILQTPFKEKYGVTVQANIANTALSGFYFKKVNKFRTCAWIILLCVATCAVMIFFKTWLSVVLVLAEFSALFWLAGRAFIRGGVIVDIAPMAFAIADGFALAILYRIRFADWLVKIKEMEINELFLSSIKALAQTIDAKDPYTRGHVERVTADALAIADQMGLSKEEKKRIHVGAILHDIGKIGVKDAVLTKPSQLTSEEKKLFDQHPDIGSRIMKPIIQLESIIPMIRHHHEAYDGTGYPDHLRGEAIPLGARIIAVADTFDAMTSDRPYRKAMPEEAAKAEINKLSGIQFDPTVVAAFNRVWEKGLHRRSVTY